MNKIYNGIDKGCSTKVRQCRNLLWVIVVHCCLVEVQSVSVGKNFMLAHTNCLFHIYPYMECLYPYLDMWASVIFHALAELS